MSDIRLFTSIRPPANGETPYLRECLASWRAAGFDVVAVNGPSEMEALRRLTLPVEFSPMSRDGKPRIGVFLLAVRASGERFAGIINSDCRMIGYHDLATKTRSRLAARRRSMRLNSRSQEMCSVA